MTRKIRWYRAALLGGVGSSVLLATFMLSAWWQAHVAQFPYGRSHVSTRLRSSSSQNENRLKKVRVRPASIIELNDIVSSIYAVRRFKKYVDEPPLPPIHPS